MYSKSYLLLIKNSLLILFLDMKLFQYLKNSISKNENLLIETNNLKMETNSKLKQNETKNLEKMEICNEDKQETNKNNQKKSTDYCFDNYAYGNPVIKLVNRLEEDD